MARKHRKLFPTETTTNRAQDCSGFCDPACPYNCYSYSNYYFSPPPPSISSGDHSSQLNHISSYVIILVSIFTVIFAVVGFYVIRAKCYADWCGWRFRGSVPSQSNNPEDELINEDQAGHPVWLIATVGLQQSIINSIAVCKYRKDEGLIEGTECSVCLNEFQEGETLRLLPKCNHAFHIPCIDTWLRSHTNCPLCRAGIVSVTNSADPEAAAASNLATSEQDGTDSGRNQEAGAENRQNDDGLSNDVGDASEAPEFTDESNSIKGQGNIGRCHAPRVLNDQALDRGVQNGEVQTENDGAEFNSNASNAMRRSSIEECLRVSPVPMKRSFSCGGRILSGRGCTSLNSTLPH